jgi:drug/metabolite transporter (DMT)-like permease
MKKWVIFAFICMMLNGIVLIFQKYITILKMDAYISMYLGISYFIGFAACLATVVIKRYPVRIPTVIYGLAGGLLSYLGSYIYILLMGVFPSSLIIPLFSCGSIFMVTIGSAAIFKEKIEKRMVIALAVGILAVAALSI